MASAEFAPTEFFCGVGVVQATRFAFDQLSTSLTLRVGVGGDQDGEICESVAIRPKIRVVTADPFLWMARGTLPRRSQHLISMRIEGEAGRKWVVGRSVERSIRRIPRKESDMTRNVSRGWRGVAMFGCLSLSAVSTGCFQTTVGGQTLPSAYYLDDDVQYFPTGPEQKLSNQIRAMERYKAEQQQGASEQAGY